MPLTKEEHTEIILMVGSETVAGLRWTVTGNMANTLHTVAKLEAKVGRDDAVCVYKDMAIV